MPPRRSGMHKKNGGFGWGTLTSDRPPRLEQNTEQNTTRNKQHRTSTPTLHKKTPSTTPRKQMVWGQERGWGGAISEPPPRGQQQQNRWDPFSNFLLCHGKSFNILSTMPEDATFPIYIRDYCGPSPRCWPSQTTATAVIIDRPGLEFWPGSTFSWRGQGSDRANIYL